MMNGYKSKTIPMGEALCFIFTLLQMLLKGFQLIWKNGSSTIVYSIKYTLGRIYICLCMKCAKKFDGADCADSAGTDRV